MEEDLEGELSQRDLEQSHLTLGGQRKLKSPEILDKERNVAIDRCQLESRRQAQSRQRALLCT